MMCRMNVVFRHCRSASARRRAWRLFSVLGGIVIWGSALPSPSLAGHRWSHLRYGTSGRIWQGRFKAFPIQEDLHLLTVMRYVERNPVRAQLVSRAEHWPWSSLGAWSRGDGSLLTEGPIVRWNGWVQHVNTPQTRAEIDATRICVQRETPFGDKDWTATTARRLGLERSLRRVG